VPTPSGAKSLSGAGKHTITLSGVYDCDGKDVGWIEIKGSNITVQNCKVTANSQYGIYSEGTGNTIQNNDIKGLKPTGDGDMNAITFFGNNTKIQFNTAIDFVRFEPVTRTPTSFRRGCPPVIRWQVVT
jgi:parallel beta-helix repeat protein